jgi:hypothetical protein
MSDLGRTRMGMHATCRHSWAMRTTNFPWVRI